jgi:hypothetical protein
MSTEMEVRTQQALASWDEMMAEATVIETPELAKDQDLSGLVGFPMIVIRMTFRRGMSRKGKANYTDKTPSDAYVSLECRLHPAPDMNRINSKRNQSSLPPITDMKQLPFEPGSVVVFNDGSTGVYRQCVAYLASKEYITLPENVPLTGEKGTSALDLAPYEWEEINEGETVFDDEGFLCAEFPTNLAAKSGIRPSSYEWEGQEATTVYLA